MQQIVKDIHKEFTENRDRQGKNNLLVLCTSVCLLIGNKLICALVFVASPPTSRNNVKLLFPGSVVDKSRNKVPKQSQCFSDQKLSNLFVT